MFRYTGDGFRPDADRPRRRSRTLARSPSSASGWPRSIRCCTSWNVGSPVAIPYETLDKRSGRTGCSAACARIVLSDRAGIQGHRRRSGMRVNFSDPLQLNRLHIAAAYSPVTIAGSERLHSTPNTSATTGAAHAAFNKADFYDLFGPTKTGRKGYAVGVGRRSRSSSTSRGG